MFVALWQVDSAGDIFALICDMAVMQVAAITLTRCKYWQASIAESGQRV